MRGFAAFIVYLDMAMLALELGMVAIVFIVFPRRRYSIELRMHMPSRGVRARVRVFVDDAEVITGKPRRA